MDSKKKRKLKGMSLIEMLLAILIFTMGMLGVTKLFSNVWKNNAYTIEMGKSSMAASQGVNKMVTYIRGTRQGDDGAYPILLANNQELTVFSDYDKDGITERLHFYKNGQNIVMGFRKPTGGVPNRYLDGDQADIIIASNVVNDSNTPVFYYFNNNYPGDTQNNPMPTPSLVSNVRLIKIYLQVNTAVGHSNNIQMQSFVEIRNLNDYDRFQ